MQHHRSPWWFVPTLYFAEGVPYVIINSVSVILFKRMGVDNAAIAFWTSWLYLPWVIKMLWGPLVDLTMSKRRWILSTQFCLALSLFAISATLNLTHFFAISLAVMIAAAFISATHDIAADGFYLLALSPVQQAFFVGIRSFFYRVAMIFGSGVLVYFAGVLEERTGDIPLSWFATLAAAGLLFAALAVYHTFALARVPPDAPGLARALSRTSFAEAFRTYFSQKGIVSIISFILLYRLGEAMLVKLATPFLLDSPDAGGLGLSTSDVGLVYGTAGVLALISGGILGGILIARFGLKKCIWPMALALNAPDLFYVYMAFAAPQTWLVYILVAAEQFGYGIGFAAYMVFLMTVAKEPFKTSHYAISTGLMALGMMLPGMLSGLIQQMAGYAVFFMVVCLLTVPGLASIFFIPIEGETGRKAQ